MEEQDVREALAFNLKRLRGQRGLSQLKLAGELHMAFTFINDIENCRKWVSPDTLARFALLRRYVEFCCFALLRYFCRLLATRFGLFFFLLQQNLGAKRPILFATLQNSRALARFATFFGVSVSELFVDEGKSASDNSASIIVAALSDEIHKTINDVSSRFGINV